MKFLYYFYATFVWSGVFAVGALNTLHGLLVIGALLSTVFNKISINLLDFVKRSFILLLWIALCTIFSPLAAKGLLLISSEYRFIIFLPVIALTLAKKLSLKEILAPIFLGLSINLVSALVIYLDYWFDWGLVGLLGIPIGSDSQFSMQGKFYQGWLACLAISIILPMVASSDGYKPKAAFCFIGICMVLTLVPVGGFGGILACGVLVSTLGVVFLKLIPRNF